MFEFFDFIKEWINSGVYDFFTNFVAFLIEMATLSYLKFLNFVIPFAWGIAQEIIKDLNISSMLNQAWGSLPDMSRAVLTAMKIPEVVNLVISGAVTKYVLKFIPGV